MSSAERLAIGAPTWAETGVWLAARLEEEALPILALLLEQLDLTILPFRAVHARTARDAFQRYGRGRHPAALDFGNCLTYAVAKVTGRPLLYVGDNFRLTDVRSVL